MICANHCAAKTAGSYFLYDLPLPSHIHTSYDRFETARATSGMTGDHVQFIYDCVRSMARSVDSWAATNDRACSLWRGICPREVVTTSRWHRGVSFFRLIQEVSFPRQGRFRRCLAMIILSVCLPNAWIVTKRKKNQCRFLYNTKYHSA